MGGLKLDNSLQVVLGMTIAYAASLLGLIVAWISYRRRRKQAGPESEGGRNDVDRSS
jgi:hypothetical protein